MVQLFELLNLPSSRFKASCSSRKMDSENARIFRSYQFGLNNIKIICVGISFFIFEILNKQKWIEGSFLETVRYLLLELRF